jgi:hypothetical protein
MLELLLNLVWVLVVTASLLLWRRLSFASEDFSRRPVTALVALICILVLLFPVISATDDLHVAEFAIEDSGRKVLRQALSVNSATANGSHAAFAHPVPSFDLATPLALTVAPVHQRRQLHSNWSFCASVPDRAPPVLV